MKKFLAMMLALAMVLSLAACGGSSAPAATEAPAAEAPAADAPAAEAPAETAGKTVGVAMPTQSSERWINDGGNMKKQLEALGYNVVLQYAEDDVQMQVSQIENMIAQGVDVLVIASIDSVALTGVEAQAKEAGSNLAHVGPGHMYTYITPVFVCDTITEEARKALQKFSMRKAFRFSLQGWLIMQTVAVEAAAQPNIYTNSAGKEKIKNLKKIFSY